MSECCQESRLACQKKNARPRTRVYGRVRTFRTTSTVQARVVGPGRLSTQAGQTFQPKTDGLIQAPTLSSIAAFGGNFEMDSWSKDRQALRSRYILLAQWYNSRSNTFALRIFDHTSLGSASLAEMDFLLFRTACFSCGNT